MPTGTEYLYPDSTVSNTDWSVTADTVHERLTSTSTSSNPATTGVLLDADGGVFVVTLGDFTEPVNFQRIDSVQLEMNYYMETKGVTNSVTAVIEEASLGSDYYSEGTGTLSYLDAYQLFNFTTRPTFDGSNPWTTARVNDVRLEITGNTNGGQLFINYLRLAVNYTTIIPTYDNSKPNLGISSGSLNVKNGTLVVSGV